MSDLWSINTTDVRGLYCSNGSSTKQTVTSNQIAHQRWPIYEAQMLRMVGVVTLLVPCAKHTVTSNQIAHQRWLTYEAHMLWMVGIVLLVSYCFWSLLCSTCTKHTVTSNRIAHQRYRLWEYSTSNSFSGGPSMHPSCWAGCTIASASCQY